MNILIVDDEIAQLQTLRRGLKRRGYGVLEALSVDEALAVIARQGDAIDCVLSDYHMPGKNGAHFFRALRSGSGNMPFILMTAYADSITGVSLLRKECDGYIEKPFSLEQIITLMEETVHRKRMSVQDGLTGGSPGRNE